MNRARAFTAAALVAALLLGTAFQFSPGTHLSFAGQLHSKIKPGSPAAIADADRPQEQNFKSDLQPHTHFASRAALAIPAFHRLTHFSLSQLPFHLAQKATFFIRAP